MNIYIVAASDTEQDAERKLRWGDYWFKDSLGKALTAEGATVTDNAAEADVVINCHGVAVQGLPEWTYNILWIIGHPDAITIDGCAEYDAVFSESAQFAEHLRAQGVACGHLPGASDFVPMDVPKVHDAVFVGNWREDRALDVPQGATLEVWGENWNRVCGSLPHDALWMGPEYPNPKLNELYASSVHLVNQTHPDMERWGFHNPRHYDILAVRGEAVPTFRDCAKALLAAVPAKRRMVDLGCGPRPRRGMMGIDKQSAPNVMPFNLEHGLPDQLLDRDARVDVIVADNLMEHITNFIPLMNDCHDALFPDGRMHITVPNAAASVEAAFSDPTHVRAFTPATWDYFNGNHERWRIYARGYGISPWRVVYVRERDRFLDVMLRPMPERKAPAVLTAKGPRVLLSRGADNWTTGAYVERALVQAGCEVTCAESVRPQGATCDLYLWVESGGREPNVPQAHQYYDTHTAGWLIDSHSHMDTHRFYASMFDHVFVAQKHLAQQVSDRAVWLPMACDPELHTPHEGIKVEHDIAFVGNVYGDHPLYAERRRLLALLAEKYDVRVESGIYFRDMADVYASARVAFNRSACGDLNMRVFEAMCSGRALVTDEVPGLGECLSLDGWALHYRNDDELADLMDELMLDAAWVKGLGIQGRNDVLAHHTYLHRVQTILQAVGL